MLENKNYLQYLLGIVLAILVMPIISMTTFLFPNIGWNLLAVIFITIFIFQISFYYLTTKHNFSWTTLSFVINFVFWILEHVIIEMGFYDSFLDKFNHLDMKALIFGGLLWVTNKILIDKLFDNNKSILKTKSKLGIEGR